MKLYVKYFFHINNGTTLESLDLQRQKVKLEIGKDYNPLLTMV